jgi:hypothetical protein
VVYPPEKDGGVLKSRESAEEKLTRKGARPGDLSDLVRATIEYSTLDKVYAGAAASVASYGEKMLQVDDKIANPTPMGYRDVAVKVRNPNGSVGEIIMSTPEILAVKNGEAHRLYELDRAVVAKAKAENRDLTVAEAKQSAEWTARSMALYEEAMKKLS